MSNIPLKEYEEIESHLASKSLKNMQIRRACQVNKKRVLKFFNILKRQEMNLLDGHISGPNIDIRYQIKRSGSKAVYTVLKSSVSLAEALGTLEKETVAILRRIDSDSLQIRPRYSEDQFYLKRNPGAPQTRRLDEAVAEKEISKEFREHSRIF